MNKRKAGEAAPYGQACLQCFKSKCKCVLRSEGGQCERCYRLNKQCEPSGHIRQRRAPRQPRSTPKIAQLEGRIDSLVTLLRNVGGSSGASAELRSALDQQNASQSSPSERSVDDPTLAASGINPPTQESPVTDSSPNSTSLLSAVEHSDSNHEAVPAHSRPPTETEQEMCLEPFRTSLLPRCPFIWISPGISAASLQRERPLFFKAICAVASPSRKEKAERTAELKRLIAVQMVVEDKSSMDLVFALLTFVAWSNEFLYRKSGLSRYMMLAMSVVYDLRLNSPDKIGDWLVKEGGEIPHGEGSESTHGREYVADEGSQGDTLERCRAVLGCFILSQCVSMYFNHIDCMQWTLHLDECIKLLEARKDKPSDAMLVFQARLYHIAQKAADFHKQSDASSPAFMLYLSALRDQLWEVKLPQPSDSWMLLGFPQAHTWNIELSIWDALGRCQPNAPVSILDNTCLRTQRIECLWKSVTAAKSVLDILLSLSPTTWVGVSLIEMSQITKSFKTLIHLTTHNDPAWDRAAVREICDPLSVLDRVIHLSNEASAAVGETARDDLFRTLASHSRGLRDWAALNLGGTVEVSGDKPDKAQARGAAESSWDPSPPFFTGLTIPSYSFFGTGEWMEGMFNEPY